MTHFWEPLSDDNGLALFGPLWPLDGEWLRLSRFLQRVAELGDGPTWPAALGALATAIDRTDSDTVIRRCSLEAARLAVVWEEPAAAQIAAGIALELGDGDDPGGNVDAMLQLGYAFSDLGQSDGRASCTPRAVTTSSASAIATVSRTST